MGSRPHRAAFHHDRFQVDRWPVSTTFQHDLLTAKRRCDNIAVACAHHGACAHHAHVHTMALQLSASMLQCPATFDPPPPAV